MKGSIICDALKIDCSGASKLNASNLECEKLQINCSGASEVNLAGLINTSTVDLSGASRLNAKQLQIRDLDITSSGASSGYVFVLDKLNAIASGASKLKYNGNPTKIDKTASGASSISRK